MVGLTVVAVVVLAPLGEELLFRGLLLRGLVRKLRFWPAAAISLAVVRVRPRRLVPAVAARGRRCS